MCNSGEYLLRYSVKGGGISTKFRGIAAATHITMKNSMLIFDLNCLSFVIQCKLLFVLAHYFTSSWWEAIRDEKMTDYECEDFAIVVEGQQIS